MYLLGGALDFNIELKKFFIRRTSFQVSFAECITAAHEMQVGFLV
jgi:hypothetical protein